MAGIGRALKNSLDDAAHGLRKFGDDLRTNQRRQADKVRDDTNQARNWDSSQNTHVDMPDVPKVDRKDIVVKPKDGWSSGQRRAFQEKVHRMNELDQHKPRNPDSRTSDFRSDYLDNGGTVTSSQDVDHIQELQLGGRITQSNAWALDQSVNRSVGSQVRHQISGDPFGTRYRVTINWGTATPPSAP